VNRVLPKVVGTVIALPAIFIIAVLFVYPFFLSVLNSFKVKDGWGLDHYKTVFELYMGDLLYTVWVSVASLVILLVFGILLGGYLRFFQNRFIEFLFKIPLFIPFVVVGHAMRVLLAPNGTLNSTLTALHIIDWQNPPSIAFSSAGIITALVWKNLSLALLLLMGAFRTVDQSFLDAARNMGAGYLRILFTILVPMAKRSIAVASVLIFTSMMGSFSIPLMLGNTEGAQMAMVDLYYQIVYQNNYGVANAIGVISYLVSMGAAIYYLRTVTKK
jgi:ABC-type Fe3+ transport system permease subunit